MRIFVSIPYEREGTFRQQPQLLLSAGLLAAGFNSLRTGRHIQTRKRRVQLQHNAPHVSIPYEREGTFRPGFQFTVNVTAGTLRFNSLRTGRHIQTKETGLIIPDEEFKSFNSLRTGRHIQTGVQHFFGQGARGRRVSIPYEREGTFRQKSRRLIICPFISFNSLRTGRHIQTLGDCQRGSAMAT